MPPPTGNMESEKLLRRVLDFLQADRSFNEPVLGGDEPNSGAKVVAKSDELDHVGKEPGAIGLMPLRGQSRDAKAGKEHGGVATVKGEGVETSRPTLLAKDGLIPVH